ncbi:DUF3732 domain-containing protein [Devosia sp. A449]
MTRWNIQELAFYGVESRRRSIWFKLDAVNVITGASGTGKSAIIDAIDYCLGSTNCGLPFYVREHAVAVAVHWVNGDQHLIVGRKIPRAGKGTEQMFVKAGRMLELPEVEAGLEGPTNRETARGMIERAFGIGDLDDKKSQQGSQKGRATVRDIPPYLFLSGDVIVSKSTLLHDLNRPEKARDIKATIPYFLGAVSQESVLAARKLRQLEAALERYQREQSAMLSARSRTTERSLALLSQAASLGLASTPSSVDDDGSLLLQLRAVTEFSARDVVDNADGRGELEQERRDLIDRIHSLREKRKTLRQAIKDASGYHTAVDGQSHKLGLIKHLNLDSGRCPVCDHETDSGFVMAEQIRSSLELVNSEVLVVDRLRPEMATEAENVDQEITRRSGRLREVDAQISALLRQTEAATRFEAKSQQRAVVIGRVHQFLEMTSQDDSTSYLDLGAMETEIASLRDLVDPEARRERVRDAENQIGVFASAILPDLPTKIPVTGARLLFSAEPKVTIMEPVRRSPLTMAEIGSDENYLAIHLALSFSLHKHFEAVEAPVPGLIVIDQISRPYYPEVGGEEKQLDDMATDEDRAAMRKIVKFLFDETGRQNGLQVILIEHAYISEDPRYVQAVRQRWNSITNERLIPLDWPMRQ